MTPRLPQWRRYSRLFGPDAVADVDDELRFHLDSKVDDLVAQGWPPDAARQEAERQFGDVRRVRKMGEHLGQAHTRRRRHRASASEALYDLRHAVRALWRDPGFAFVTILIIALGIAANTTVFSVVNTMLLRPLPFPAAHELTWLTSGRHLDPEARKTVGLSGVTYTVAAFEEFQRHNQSFSRVTSYNPFFGNSEYALTGSGDPQIVAGVMVAGNFFQTLGVQPVHGRSFVREELMASGRRAVLLDHAFWRRQFGSAPDIVGRTITLDTQPVTVVGILPPSFDFGSVFSPGLRFDVVVPAVMDDIRTWGNTLAIVGRLKPGVSVAEAQAEADVLFPRLQAAHPEWWGDYTSTVTSLKDFVSGTLKRPLSVLWCAVGLIFLMVCVNLSSLLLARASARSQEFAMRTALGASRARVFRQLLAESAVFTGAGAIIGLGMAVAVTTWLAGQGALALPLLERVTVDGVAVLWTVGLVGATSLLFGLVPALRLPAGNVQTVLRSSGRGITGSHRLERLRAILVVTEVTVACVLLIGAGLLLRSFLNVLDVDPGFMASRAAVITIAYDDGDDGGGRGIVLREIVDAVTAIPGIETAGVADMLPLGRNRSWGLKAADQTYERDHGVAALVRIVTPGYLKAMGMRLREGRDFSWSDMTGKEPLVIVNEAAVRRHWPDRSPIGRLAKTTGSGGWRDARVIGVIANVRQQSLESAVDPEMYLPAWQAEPEGAELVVRSALPLSRVAPSVMHILRSLNPNQPASAVHPLQDIVDRSVSPRRFVVLLVSSFAALGLLLASLGIFGVISYSVKQRTQEIGVRMALGASATQVKRQVLGRALRLAAAGAVLGTLLSYAVARAIASLLFETAPADPSTFLVVALLVGALAAIAGYLPARTASRIEPMAALRSQ